MIVEQIWTGNRLRNFNYLVACPETGEALAIDPLDHGQCLAVAHARGWTITRIVNTHEHGDHIGGNGALAAQTGADIVAHAHAVGKIANVARPVRAGDTITVGTTVELWVMDTPGHTMSHVCLLYRGTDDGNNDDGDTSKPALFSGDTMFNAGVGNCHNGGHPEALYRTFVEQIQPLDDATRLFPGHDYLFNNLAFTLAREPGNQKAAEMLARESDHDPSNSCVTDMALERQINVFLRLDSAEVIETLRPQFPNLGENPSPETVFLNLRELRNRW